MIPELDQDLKHLLWLDYDFRLNSVVVTDVSNATAALSVGSILLVTVDVEPPTNGKDGTPRKWRKYFLDECGGFCEPGWPLSDYAQSKLHEINVRIIDNAIQTGLAGRKHVSFLPLFNFSYADGHEMLTIGGVIGTATEKGLIDGCDFSDAVYLRTSFQTPAYRVPRLNFTRKEKLYLDSAMPAKKNWKPRDFELDQRTVEEYSEVYRYYPSYAELLL